MAVFSLAEMQFCCGLRWRYNDMRVKALETAFGCVRGGKL
jgi:hypothetical protein